MSWCSIHESVELNYRIKQERKAAEDALKDRFRRYKLFREGAVCAHEIIDSLISEILAREPKINTIERMMEFLK